MMTVATTLANVALSEDLRYSENKPCTRAIVNGIALAIPLWTLVIWGIRTLF